MKYYIIACFDKSLSNKEADELNLVEFVVTRSENEVDLPEFVYTGKIESDDDIKVLTKTIKNVIIGIVKDNFCFLSVSADRNWDAFKC